MRNALLLAGALAAAAPATLAAESVFFKSPGPGMRFTAGLPVRVWGDLLPRDEQPGWPLAELFWDNQLVATAVNNPDAFDYFPLQVPGNLSAAGLHQLRLKATFRSGAVREVTMPVQVDPWPPDRLSPCSADSGQQFCLVELTSDRTFTNLDWTNVAVRGNGHKITVNGSLNIRNSLITGLGSLTGIEDPYTAVMVPGITGTLTGNVMILNSTFEATGALDIVLNGGGDVWIRHNEFRASNFIGFVPNDPERSPVIRFTGSNTRRKLFQGNRIASGRVVFERMDNWVVGADNYTRNSEDDGNILMGPRCTINVIECDRVVVRGNYSHHNYRGEWSQGFNFVLGGSAPDLLVEHNLIRGGSWPVQGLVGEFRYNVVVGYGHQWIRTVETGARIHHNVFTPEGGGGLGSGIWAYLPWYMTEANNVQIYNNTMDGGALTGDFAGPFVEVSDPLIQVTSLRNNLFTYARDLDNGSPGRPLVEATDGSIRYADYEAFYSPDSSQPENYEAVVPGHNEGEPGYAGHDVSGTGEVGVINGRLAAHPFAGTRLYPYTVDEAAVWNRQLKLSTVLADFRARYKPAAGSPVIDHGDVADTDSQGRRADIGAIDRNGHDLDLFGRYGAKVLDQALPAIPPADAETLSDEAPPAPLQPPPARIFPNLIGQTELRNLVRDTAGWNTLKARCDANLGKTIGSGYSAAYAGWDWRDAAEDYALCYNIARMRGLDAATISAYSKKAVGLLKVLARHHWYRTVAGSTEPEGTVEYLGLGNGMATTFPLPRPPLSTASVKVYLTPATELAVTYASNRYALPAGYVPILKISNAPGGPPAYVKDVDYHLAWYNTLTWLGTNHPAPGATYYATVADKALQTVTGATVTPGAVIFATPPAANQVVAVQYVSADYEQTGNFMGGVEGIKPDALYMHRTINVGLAYAYDLMCDSSDLTPALRAELVSVLNAQVDFYEDWLVYDPTVPNDPYGGPEGSGLGNYSVRGHLSGLVYTAYGTAGDNPREAELKALARTVLLRTAQALDRYTPGGFGAEGSYNSGSDSDLLHLFDIWKRVSGEDVASSLQWTSNLVPAIIHGTKPDLTFYDGGDWHSLPAVPHVSTLLAFVKYQAGHPMAPYARQLLMDLGQPVPGPTADYRTFPRSRLLAGTGALYARSSWDATATWLSLATGPMFLVGHQHYDRGHFTLHRGSDYLLINGGQFGGGARGTVPFHNSLGFDDRGAGNLIVYPSPPSQGAWEDIAQSVAPKHVAGAGFVYGQENLTPSYVNNDGVSNAVKRAVRTVVFLEPDVVVLHDQAQTFNAGTRKFFNVTFAGTVTRSGDVFSAPSGQSKVFMRSVLPANPSPTISPRGTLLESDPDNTSYPIRGDNYQVVLPTGQADDTFLHVFQAAPSAQAQMAPSAYLRSTDNRAQGVAVNMGARRWVVLSAVKDPQLAGSLVYTLPMACPCTHVVGDVLPNRSYQVTVRDAGGGVVETTTAATGAAGLLSFATARPDAASVTLTPGP